MRAKLYISQSEVGLDFQTQEDRDRFFKSLASTTSFGFSPQMAAVKAGDRAIRLDPASFRLGWIWEITFEE